MRLPSDRLDFAFFVACALGPLALAAPASAHVGMVPSKATFCQPPPVSESPLPGTDGGVRYDYAPADADAWYRLSWSDGDLDPTGKFTFYYIDHQLPVAVGAAEVEATAKIVTTTDGREARNVYVSCACGFEDGGLSCDGGRMDYCADGGERWCDNDVVWDTSTVPEGVYWIAAVNDDPPFFVYETSETPVRVTHSAKVPPVVVVLRPDGLGPGAQSSYDVQVLLAGGTPPYTLDLAWGLDQQKEVDLPLHSIVRGLKAAPGPDGTFHYDWDVSALDAGVYFVSATVTDANGLSSTSNSRYGASVFHRPDGGTRPPDASTAAPGDGGTILVLPPSTPNGCSCNLSARRGQRAGRSAPPVALAALLVAGLLVLRRRRS